MANIPSIRRSLAPLSNIKKRGPFPFARTEETAKNTRSIRPTERRSSRERRQKNIKIIFDRRKTTNRRNKTQFNRSNIANNDETTGLMIDTTA